MANQMSWSPSSACSPGFPTLLLECLAAGGRYGHQCRGNGGSGDHERSVAESPGGADDDRDRPEHCEGEEHDDGVHDEGMDGHAVDEIEHGREAMGAHLPTT